MRRNKILRVLVRTSLLFVLLSVILVTLLRWVPVRYTPVMLKRAFQFRGDRAYRTEQEWVSLEEIAPELIDAVIIAEDQKFFAHHGFDFVEIRRMWMSHRRNGTRLRGCSTLSQQTAKNVFTFGTRTWLRKAVEPYWTVLIEQIWGKRRILEVYLNVVEWGRGTFGAETASRRYFGTHAASLRTGQAAAMAACLPKPLLERPDGLSPEGRRKQRLVVEQMPEALSPGNRKSMEIKNRHGYEKNR